MVRRAKRTIGDDLPNILQALQEDVIQLQQRETESQELAEGGIRDTQGSLKFSAMPHHNALDALGLPTAGQRDYYLGQDNYALPFITGSPTASGLSVVTSDDDGFDPTALFHVTGDDWYIQYDLGSPSANANGPSVRYEIDGDDSLLEERDQEVFYRFYVACPKLANGAVLRLWLQIHTDLFAVYHREGALSVTDTIEEVAGSFTLTNDPNAGTPHMLLEARVTGGSSALSDVTAYVTGLVIGKASLAATTDQPDERDVLVLERGALASGMSATVTGQSVEVSWVDAPETPDYSLQYRRADAVDWTAIRGTHRSPYTLSGLAANTAYLMRYKAIYPAPLGPTGWIDQVEFTTGS